LRPLLFFLLGLLCFGAGCGESKTGGETTEETRSTPSDRPAASQLPPAEVTQTPGRELIQESPLGIPVDGLFLNVYFDEAGTQREHAVSAGETFSMGVFAETIDPYTTNCVQYRLDLPPGIRIAGTSEFAEKSISMGNVQENYLLAYRCQPAGKFRVVEYLCVAEPGFRGGEVQVLAGVPGKGTPFLGFVTCEYNHAAATGGTAILKRK
jgi:hypothetical protein